MKNTVPVHIGYVLMVCTDQEHRFRDVSWCWSEESWREACYNVHVSQHGWQPGTKFHLSTITTIFITCNKTPLKACPCFNKGTFVFLFVYINGKACSLVLRPSVIYQLCWYLPSRPCLRLKLYSFKPLLLHSFIVFWVHIATGNPSQHKTATVSARYLGFSTCQDGRMPV